MFWYEKSSAKPVASFISSNHSSSFVSFYKISRREASLMRVQNIFQKTLFRHIGIDRATVAAGAQLCLAPQLKHRPPPFQFTRSHILLHQNIRKHISSTIMALNAKKLLARQLWRRAVSSYFTSTSMFRILNGERFTSGLNALLWPGATILSLDHKLSTCRHKISK